MSKLGVVLPFSAFPGRDVVTLAQEAETRGYDMAWAAEASGADALVTLGIIASHTTRLHVATGIVPIQTRTPIVLTMAATTLGHVAPGRMALGIGVSSPIIVGQWHGLPFRKPLQHMRETVQILRLALSGERVNFEGEFHRIKNFRLSLPPTPVRIFLGALGPKMLELAGEVADGVLLNWLAPETVGASIRHLEAGARRAGRSLADFEIAAFVRTCVTDVPARAREWLARDITGYAIVDSYGEFFRTSGYAAEVDAVNAAWKAGDRAGAVTKISPRVVDGLGVIGPAAFCRERVAEFAKAGLTMPVIMPFSPDADPRPSLLGTIRSFP